MAISVKHAFQSAKADGPDSTLVQPSSWNAEHTITAAAGKVLGRDTSGAGAIQELPIAVDVSGNVALGGALSVDGNTTLGNASTDSVTLNANTVSIPNNVNFSGGNVGIGTSSPSTFGKLAVASSDDSNTIVAKSDTGLIRMKGYQTSSSSGVLEATNPTQSAYIPMFVNGSTLLLGTGGSERARIDSTGNVGIGTTTPGAKLHVFGNNGTFGTNSFFGLNGSTPGIAIGNNGSIGLIQGQATATSSTSADIGLQVNGGNLGIGTSSPQASLDVNGDIVLRNGVYFEMTAPASKSAAATLTGAEVVQGYVQYTGAAANLTLPTATNLQAAMPSGVATLNDIAFDFTVINTGSGTATLVVNTGITAVGALTTAAGTATTFHIRKTATNTFIVYRT